MKHEYTLWYNAKEKRYGMLDATDCWYNSGLHCGACFDVLIGKRWKPVRLEYSDWGGRYASTRGWYLCDGDGALKNQPPLDGLRVRVEA